MNTQATGAIRPKSDLFSFALPANRAEFCNECDAAKAAFLADLLLQLLARIVRTSPSLAFRKPEADRNAPEMAGHSQALEGGL
jgi:hypothetical protein